MIDRRERAWRLYVDGQWTMAQIARELGVTDKTVCQDLHAEADRRLAAIDTLVDRHRVAALERQDAHDRQVLPLLMGDVPGKQVAVTRVRTRNGKRARVRELVTLPPDPMRVALVQLKAHARLLASGQRRDRLLGLEMPVKVAPTDPTGTVPYQRLSLEDLRKLRQEREAELRARGVVIDVPPRRLPPGNGSGGNGKGGEG